MSFGGSQPRQPHGREVSAEFRKRFAGRVNRTGRDGQLENYSRVRPGARGAQLIDVHLFKIREPALDLLLADGRELDGELEPASWCVSLVATPTARSSRLGALSRSSGRLDGVGTYGPAHASRGDGIMRSA